MTMSIISTTSPTMPPPVPYFQAFPWPWMATSEEEASAMLARRRALKRVLNMVAVLSGMGCLGEGIVVVAGDGGGRRWSCD